MNIVRLMLAAALSVSLFGCGSSSPPSAPPKPPREDTAGIWRGTSTRFQAEARSCPHPGLVTLQVWDDKFQYRWDGKTWVDAAIGADAIVRGQGPGITLIGKHAGDRIEGDITNGDCGLHFTVMKKDN